MNQTIGKTMESKPVHSGFTIHIEKTSDLGEVIWLRHDNPTHPEENIQIGITPKYGSNMFAFRRGEIEIIYCDREALSQRHDFTGNLVLWPFIGRVRDRKWMFEGKTHSLHDIAIPRGGYPLVHGLVRDRVWLHDSPLTGEDFAEVTTWVDMTPESPYWNGFPFQSRLSLTYTLKKDSLRVTYTVRNMEESEKLPFGFAMHPAFSTQGKNTEGIRLCLPAQYIMEADADILPTGKLLDVSEQKYSSYDLHIPKPVTDLEIDDVYTGLDPNSSAFVDYPALGMNIRILTSPEFTHAIAYTHERDRLVCLEHLTSSTDAHNLHEKGFTKEAHLMILEPGKTLSGYIEYNIQKYK